MGKKGIVFDMVPFTKFETKKNDAKTYPKEIPGFISETGTCNIMYVNYLNYLHPKKCENCTHEVCECINEPIEVRLERDLRHFLDDDNDTIIVVNYDSSTIPASDKGLQDTIKPVSEYFEMCSKILDVFDDKVPVTLTLDAIHWLDLFAFIKMLSEPTPTAEGDDN